MGAGPYGTDLRRERLAIFAAAVLATARSGRPGKSAILPYHFVWHCATSCGTVPLTAALYHYHAALYRFPAARYHLSAKGASGGSAPRVRREAGESLNLSIVRHYGFRDGRPAKGRLVAHLAAAARCPLGAAAHRVRILVPIVVPPRRGARGCAAGGGVWGACKFVVR